MYAAFRSVDYPTPTYDRSSGTGQEIPYALADSIAFGFGTSTSESY